MNMLDSKWERNETESIGAFTIISLPNILTYFLFPPALYNYDQRQL